MLTLGLLYLAGAALGWSLAQEQEYKALERALAEMLPDHRKQPKSPTL